MDSLKFRESEPDGANGEYDFLDFTHSADRVQPFEKLIGLRFMHRSFDDAQRNRVYTNTVLGILHRECACHRVQSAFCHHLNGHRYTCDRVPH
jgi:hypothetical protein